MEKRKYGRILIGISCVLVLILVVMTALILDSRSLDPVFGIFTPQEQTEQTTEPSNPSGETGETQPTDAQSGTVPGSTPEETTTPEPSTVPEESVTPPQELPPSVEITPDAGKELRFPCQIPGYGLTVEKLAPYSGMFVEDGTNATVSEVAMLLVYNDGDFPVEYTRICIQYGQEELVFDISALPVGERLVVQEKTGKAVPAGKPDAANAMVVQRADMELSKDKISVTDNGDNTLTIRNLTNQMIPTVRVFYKYYMEDEDVFVGGISFTLRITRLAAGASVTVQPSHYNSQTSRLVMVLTYDSEV